MTPTSNILTACICGNPACDIPFGLCHCGCGQKTNIALKGCAGRVFVRGMPLRRLHGHVGRSRTKPCATKLFEIDGVCCRLIPLTRGQNAIVDAADYEWLSQWKWYAKWSRKVCGFYAARGFWSGEKTRTIFMHRLILELALGDKRLGDHQNSNTLDNRRANLRIATASQNSYNRGAKSGYKGVSWDKNRNRWSAEIKVQGRHIHLGRFATAEEAHAAYCKAAAELHGEFARMH